MEKVTEPNGSLEASTTDGSVPGHSQYKFFLPVHEESDEEGSEGHAGTTSEVHVHGQRMFTVVPVSPQQVPQQLTTTRSSEDHIYRTPLIDNASTTLPSLPPDPSHRHGWSVHCRKMGADIPICASMAYSPNSTVKSGDMNCMTSYNHYHTISGMVPSTYHRPTYHRPLRSRKQYGIGSSSRLELPPSFLSLFQIKDPNGKSTDLPRVSTDPFSTPTTALHHREPFNSSSSEQMTVTSLNQMTVRSAGGLSVGVGSTDGHSMMVHGTLSSPEQLPLIPDVFSANGSQQKLDKQQPTTRQTWGNSMQFVLACIGAAVGLGNFWRFPYLCYKSGGGAFLIPYFIMLFLCGVPLLLMELAVGQYTRRGPIAAMGMICPILQGSGMGTVVVSFLFCTYYNVIICWSIYYLVQSFTSPLPWTNCNTTWAIHCFQDYTLNGTTPNNSKSPAEEFFDEVVLEKSEGIDMMGSMRLELLGFLFVAWVLVYFCVWKSVRSTGRVVYFTATMPYLLIGAFLWRALTLPGASVGLQYLFNPRWELLLKAEVWVNAAAQNFNSIGIAFGSLIAFSSYNKFNNNLVTDTWIIALVNSATSLCAGMIVFSTMGNIAVEQKKNIEEVVAEGPGLVFMVYPRALAQMPYANVWAVLFFCMLLILGLDSQFASVEVIITSLQDAFPKWIKKHLKYHEILVLLVCFTSFCLGIPNIMQGGIYYFQLIDYYAAAVSLMYLAFFEVIAIVWVYGAARLSRNIREMTGRLPSFYFRFCWYFSAPLLILAIWIFSLVDYKSPTYNKGEYVYPDWAIGLGWVIASFSIIPIPAFAIVAIVRAKGASLWEKMKNSVRSTILECPCCGVPLNCLDEAHSGSQVSPDHLALVKYNQTTNNDNSAAPETGGRACGLKRQEQQAGLAVGCVKEKELSRQ